MESIPRTPTTPSGRSLRRGSTAVAAGGRRPGRYALATVAAVSVALATAGCQNDPTSAEPAGTGQSVAGDATPDTTSPSGGTPAEAPGTPAASTTASASPAAPGSAAPGPDRCGAAELTMSLKPVEAGAGQVYYRLTFVNESSDACVLDGFPGVSLIKRDGSVIGVPAEREGPAHTRTVIEPGKTARADLHTVNQGIADSPCWDRPDYLKVYPPGSKDALTLRTVQPLVCGDRFTTTAVG
ncbi:DUF4232 domain-containing protein [Streptomyces sp. NBC_01754]|uniref:DUF4232 domain-containing protein n=1 Tax=Streptomyces sp. NBC_01754 TaxID=2975930 RepID=UPI002DDB4F61|nr:DUF4232 domain-containing protein [Streptomyces sp. NBC_01754]WSC91939.1 DUF4232 domain-containing protein [Streptomyces sp. NBC_01754]